MPSVTGLTEKYLIYFLFFLIAALLFKDNLSLFFSPITTYDLISFTLFLKHNTGTVVLNAYY